MSTSYHVLEEAARQAPDSTVDAAARLLRAGRTPVKAAFVARALNALTRLTTKLDDRSLGDASGATCDFAVLLRALEEPATLAASRADDPLAPARLRWLRDRERLLQLAGQMFTVDEVAHLLKISRQAVDKRRRSGRLIGLRTGRHGYDYPACQFDEQGNTLPHLEAVLAELDDDDPWTRLIFLVNPNTALDGETPLAMLRRGQLEATKRAARMYGEQGAA